MQRRLAFVASSFLFACTRVPSPAPTSAAPATTPGTPSQPAPDGMALADASVAAMPSDLGAPQAEFGVVARDDLGVAAGDLGVAAGDLGVAAGDLAEASLDLGSTQPSPAPRHPWTVEPSGATADLFAVWGSSANDLYVVGAGGTILHSTGMGDWSQEDSGTSADLLAVWGSGPNDVHAVGWNGVHVKRDATGSWAAASSPSMTNRLTAIWGFSADELFITADQDATPAAIIRTSDGGASWTTVPMTDPNARVTLNGIWGNAGGELWASGIVYPYHPGADSCGTLWQSNDRGASWTVTMSDGTGSNPYWCVWGQPSSPQPLVCMRHPTLEAYDPATARMVGEGGFYAMWGVGTDLFELTTSGDIVTQSDGAGLTVDYRGTAGWQLRAIWGTALDHVFVVGTLGLILRRDR